MVKNPLSVNSFDIYNILIFTIFTGNTCVGVPFYKVADRHICNFIKKSLQQRCFLVAKFLRNTNFEEHLRMTASELTLRSDSLELCLAGQSL